MKTASRLALLALAAGLAAVGWMILPADVASSSPAAGAPAAGGADPWTVSDEPPPAALFYDRFPK